MFTMEGVAGLARLGRRAAAAGDHDDAQTYASSWSRGGVSLRAAV
jgi:hypothetical protein